MNNKRTKAKLFGYIFLDNHPPCFALPLFRHESGSCGQALVQEINEINGLVSGFRILEDQNSHIIQCSLTCIAQVGYPYVYVFVDSANFVVAGTISMIGESLKFYADEYKQNAALSLQIAELVGSVEEKQLANLKMREAITEKSGEMAAFRFYEGSVLRTRLWEFLLSKARDSEAAQRILSSRSRISAKIDIEGNISIDLSAISESDIYFIDKKEIETRLKEDLVQISIPPKEDKSNEDAEVLLEHGGRNDPNAEDLERYVDDTVFAFMRKLQQASRQEERISIFLDAVFHSKEVRQRIIRIYPHDKAKKATNVIAIIRSHIARTDRQPAIFDQQNEDILWKYEMLKDVFSTFSRGPMSRRDILMHFLVHHLAKYKDVGIILREMILNSKSRYITVIASRLLSELDSSKQIK